MNDSDLLQELQAMLKRADVPAFEEAFEFQRRLQASPDLANTLPEIVWHWLTDTDIRSRDGEYRMWQDAQLRHALVSMCAPEGPARFP